MKLLISSRLEAINSALTFDTADCKITCRIESYSCKMAGEHKKLFKMMNAESSSKDLQALSPPSKLVSHSPSGAYSRSQSDDGDGLLCDTISRKTLSFLIGTLNASFSPDYDFSQSKSDEFTKIPTYSTVIKSVDSTLLATAKGEYANVQQELWAAIDHEITLQDCDIYSYNPDFTSDPYGEAGCLWSFNYFFYNKKIKRIVFLTCRAMRASYLLENSMDDDDDSFYMDLDDDCSV